MGVEEKGLVLTGEGRWICPGAGGSQAQLNKGNTEKRKKFIGKFIKSY